MEIFKLLALSIKRVIGFIIVISIISATAFFIGKTNAQISAFIVSTSIIIIRAFWNRFIGSLDGDIAVLIRFAMNRSHVLVDKAKETIKNIGEMRYPPVVPIQEYEVLDWKDAENSQRLRRTLMRGRMPILLGQYYGNPRVVDLANDIGKLYICAPDRMGKTELIKCIIASILLGHPMAKRDIDFYFIDITRDLSVLRPLGTYTHEMSQALKIMRDLGKEVDRRNKERERFQHAGWWHEIPIESRPKTVVLVIDEAIQVLKEGGSELSHAWSNLINIGWKNGILMITTSLYTRGDLIPTEFTKMMRGKVCGNMGSRQGWVNVVEDYYETHRDMLDNFVNVKYHFALCVRPDKPMLFRSVMTPKERLMSLVEEAVVDANDWREVILTVFWRSSGMASAEEIARQSREFIIRFGGGVRPESVHKKTVLETLRYAVAAGIVSYNGPKQHYTPHINVTSFGQFLEEWDKFVAADGLTKRAPEPEDMKA